jgi:4-amino-4-deoxy-L-arabinose transferase-like glycosyltransferase
MKMRDPQSSHLVRWRFALVGLLLLLLAGAAWLRWRYIQEISLYVDEFTTLWAAKRVQQVGLPIMPSGVLYTRGLLTSYVEALFLSVFGFSYTVGRLPSLLFGLLTISALWLVGGRWWRPSVGWLAALGLTLLPEAIVWSGRARFYAQLQFFVLLTTWAALVLTIAPMSLAQSTPPSRPLSVGFVLLFSLALFSQEEALLLYPLLLLALVIWRGWRALLQPTLLAAQTACLLVILLRLVIEIFGQPGYLETIQAQRPYVGLRFDLAGAWRTYGPLLLAPERLPWTLCGMLAVGAALGSLRNVGWRLSALTRFHQATLFFALHFVGVLLFILFFVGSTWREARYLFLVQPFWLLTGAAGAIWLLERLGLQTPLRHWPAVALLSGLVVASVYPRSQQIFTQQVEGYDHSLAYLAQQRQAGDVVLSPQPPACALVLGACDYYALQRGYAEFVIQREGVWIDRWTGSPLLNTNVQLVDVLRRAPVTWLVTDSFRLATRYEADFVRTVVEQFDLAFAERGVMVLRAASWRPSPVQPITRTLSIPASFPPLVLIGWERNAAVPGSDLHVTLLWQGAQPIDRQYNTSVKVADASGRVIRQDDGPPARGLIPTTLLFATPRPDPKRLALPADLARGRYRIEVSAYAADTLTALADSYVLDWFWVGEPPAPPAQRLAVGWENGLQLVGADPFSSTVTAGEHLSLRLVWRTTRPVTQNYTAFLHLAGADGIPLAQDDRAPAGGFYPTSAWAVEEWMEDVYTIAVPATTPAGVYRLLVGFYDPVTNQRLLRDDGADAFVLGGVEVTR